MAKEYAAEITGHPNIYTGSPRQLKIHFTEPDKRVTRKTGILLLICGFGAHPSSKVYQKMRQQFADLYDLVVVQCEYFGTEFMQSPKSFTLSMDLLNGILTEEDKTVLAAGKLDISSVLSQYDGALTVREELNESAENFNDMGIMQCLDNIAAVMTVQAILRDNRLDFDTQKVIIYGQSHGAYLAYLCNRLAPGVFSLIIDNSAWLVPVYLYCDRLVTLSLGKFKVNASFNYYARREFDEEFLMLPQLYHSFSNECSIVCFHGKGDTLISADSKRKFCARLTYCNYFEIGDNQLDGRIFKSTDHGLGADFLELFHYVMNERSFTPKLQAAGLTCPSQRLITKQYEYLIEYIDGLPVLQRYRQS